MGDTNTQFTNCLQFLMFLRKRNQEYIKQKTLYHTGRLRLINVIKISLKCFSALSFNEDCPSVLDSFLLQNIF